MRAIPVAAILLVTVSMPATSNDTLVTLAAGGLVPVKSAQIVMESEDLEISIHKVTVTYRFRNESDHDVVAVVAFPLPALNGGDLENVPMRLPSKDPVNFMDFRVTEGDKAIAPMVEIRAFQENRDVTGRVKSSGLPVSVADKSMEGALQRIQAQQRASLVKDELVWCDDERGAKQRCAAMWETRIQYYWTQRFPARSTITLRQSYQPVVGGSYLVASMQAPSTKEEHCVGKPDLLRIAEFKKRHPVKSQDDFVLWENRIQYILTTGNNWSGPIRNFHLAVTTESAEDLLMTCEPGLKQTSPMRYEMTRANYSPPKDLDLLILTGKNYVHQ
jgi:hypothetical protein